ncbi:S8 family serine peptidase [Halolamina sp. CBA1230]|uniref:S8 family serine peptidase n=1 Tax=Halolamina sp. CBA1230 TaxID=1853690 RepID=UPI0020D04D4D|nr:S8 family serine peptidase [Halolamina sp. CBA1230]
MANDTESGVVEVIVRVEEFEVPEVSTMTSEDVVEGMKSHAETTQQPIVDYAESTDGVALLNQYWITNAVLLRVDTRTVDAESIVGQPGVTGVHSNFQVNALAGSENGTASGGANTTDAPTGNVTYGLDQLNVPEVWEEHGTRGAGVKVAVLDTGIDAGHTDLSLYTENPSDETYPGGWAEFDDDGERVEGSTPHATSQHGTHVSGTVAGGDASGAAIGVAPDAQLMHGLVIPGGSGSFAQIIGGIEWAVEEDADVIGMSLGAEGYYTAMIDPIRNAEDAGTIVVAASGNAGPETVSSPGNIHDALSIGASGPDRDIARFSSGDVVQTDRDWADAAPSDWPSSYVVPDVSAPGVDTYSTLPGDEYGEKSGTSMATPHIVGVVALMESAAGGEISANEVKAALKETATKPDGAPAGQDSRYGHGIVDALAATTTVAADQGIDGTVTNTDGTPLVDATVTVDNGAETTTNETGQYLVRTLPGTYNVTVSEFGYETANTTVSVNDSLLATRDVSLAPTLAAGVIDPQDDQVESGGEATVTYHTAHADSLTVTRVGTMDGNATLFVDGTEYAFGEPIDLDPSDDTTVSVRVEMSAEASGELMLDNTVTGDGETTTLTTGPTDVVPDPTYVGIVDSTGSQYADQLSSAVEANVPGEYFVSVVDPSAAMTNTDQYDVLAVHRVGSEIDLGAFVAATSDPDTGVVYLDQWGVASNGITALSDATQNPVVTGQSTETDGAVYDVVRNHTLFDGVASAGGTITIHNQSRGDIAWFQRYDGTTLATATDGGDEVLGTGVAVDESTQTVLLSSLGRSSTVRNQQITDDANALLGNAITYVDSLPPAWFESEQPAHVTPGESFTVDVVDDDLERLNVTLADDSTVDTANLTLTIGGTEREFGESYAVNGSGDPVPVEVTTSTGMVGTAALSMAAEGSNETVELRSGETAVYAKPLVVPEDVGTIQQAVDLAPAGATIEIANGTYTNPVEVTTPGVTLTAHGDERPTIETRISGFYEPVVHVNAPDVTVERLDVVAQGIAPDGIAVERSNATIRHVSVGGAANAILIGGAGSTADGAVVHDVTVTEGSDLLARGVSVGEADDAHVYNATISGQNSGIDVYDSANTVIENNTVTDSGVGYASFETDNLRLVNNQVYDGDGTKTRAATVGIQLEAFVTSATVEGNRIGNVEEGIFVSGVNTGAEITRNEVTGAEYGVWIEGGDLPALDVQYNDLAAANVSVGSNLDRTLSATLNYHGDRDDEAFVEGDVAYEPFLTAPPEQVDTNETRRFGVDLTLEAGNVYGVGVPGATDQTVSELFSDGFEGAVYGFDATDQSWTLLSGDDPVGALQGLAVVADSDGRMTITHHVGTGSPTAPGQQTLTEGWNFVGAPEYDGLNEAFGAGTVDPTLAMSPFASPETQPGPSGGFDGVYRFDGSASTAPEASAYQGYFVFVEEESTLPSYVVPNPSVTELYQGIGVYDSNATADANTSANGSTTATASVESVLANANGTDRDLTRELLSQVISREIQAQLGGEIDSQAELDAAVDAIVDDAPADRRDLVAAAAADAIERLRGGTSERRDAVVDTSTTAIPITG